ncbi:hypothetical protein [Helicobacter rodentium]|uniref:hypothetical protein n=1 Tax=Helicobacter rodentium TaxID=59617 RepID=UPI0023F380DD|nr:hypothetical protein [Helicobacter rodentium]
MKGTHCGFYFAKIKSNDGILRIRLGYGLPRDSNNSLVMRSSKTFASFCDSNSLANIS